MTLILNAPGKWWSRKLLGDYVPPLNLATLEPIYRCFFNFVLLSSPNQNTGNWRNLFQTIWLEFHGEMSWQHFYHCIWYLDVDLLPKWSINFHFSTSDFKKIINEFSLMKPRLVSRWLGIIEDLSPMGRRPPEANLPHIGEELKTFHKLISVHRSYH